MKKLLALLLALSLLAGLPVSASAEGDGRSVECDNVMLTVTGCCTTPGADGVPRLTLFLSAGNKNDAPRTVTVERCVIGACELPVSFTLALDAWESRETALVVPLAPLAFVENVRAEDAHARLGFAVTGEETVSAPWLTLHVGPLSVPEQRECAEGEVFHRFGVRVLPLGADWDGRWLTAWLMLENNNDFPVRLTGSAGDAIFAGASVGAHSRAAFRVDFPGKTPADRRFALRCGLEGYADGTDKAPAGMASFQAELSFVRADDDWSLAVEDASYENDQGYIARVGMRDFHYDEYLPLYEVDPDAPLLSARESGLVSLVCCGGYEILAGDERAEGTRAVLPLTLRSFTQEALTLRVTEGEPLPCLTGAALLCLENGSAAMDFVFDAGSLAYADPAESQSLTHSFVLTVAPASDPEQSYGAYPAERTCAVREIEPKEPSGFEALALGALRVEVLGLELTDGLSLWLRVQNVTGRDAALADERTEGMLNSSAVSFLNSAPVIPAASERLVLLRAAEFSDAGEADPFAFHTPPLSELNTLKLRLGEQTVTLMFRHNGSVMLVSAA